MGYKDWGCWNLVHDFFTQNDFGFVKYNVSHNGGTTSNPIDFPDLEAFRKNSYSKELHDLDSIIEISLEKFNSASEIYLIGHSRGGGIALLQSANPKISKIVTWAGISHIKERFPQGEKLVEWKKNGTYYIENGRTKQQMPHDYSQYEEFLNNEERLNIEYFCKNSACPTLVIHGDNDTSVPLIEGQFISSWLNTSLTIIEGANHTFGSVQPWNELELPAPLKIACEKTLSFFTEK